MRATTRLRQLINAKETLIVPGCYNAMTAKIIEQVGFPAVYMTGYGTSLALLGMPDAGLATMSEMHLNARYIANAVKIPLIADCDNGYGNAINVIRAVREYIQTGTAGIHIEDQIIPKRCGHVAGRQVIPMAEACGKFRAAKDIRDELDPDFVIIARTDARGAVGGNIDVAIERANAYLEAGADVAFVEGPTTREEIAKVCEQVEGPVLYNQTGVSPRLNESSASFSCPAAARSLLYESTVPGPQHLPQPLPRDITGFHHRRCVSTTVVSATAAAFVFECRTADAVAVISAAKIIRIRKISVVSALESRLKGAG